ncbi:MULTISPECIES: TetR/AcrR family transcriptional regulator [unclassified Nocardioides]|uniref:TetR/AcrR family transcriptional regulator n=1 Tax=unclassified Nocardioides TaxID=2615069 RepID=UPI0006F4574A|nr:MULTISPECIES: TetR/AcrR family transcriptional regulator [unclassified Nocardioides]KRA30014.1 TetR family transcriptional regulator [Nocardioides sp. Root614]KRA86934.1 TetR family transcriptional regulator [Nocardioides sp. Root682]
MSERVARTGRTLPSGEQRPVYNLDRLLEVAVQVFTERGYDGTSFAHLAEASGLSKSSIFHHIESKEQLLRLGLERALDPLMASTEEDAALQGPAIDRLTYLIRRNIEILADRLPYVTLLLNVHGNTETERWALEQRRAYDKFVSDVVEDAIAQGDVRADIDARTTARLLFGMINSVREWYRPERHTKPAKLAEEIGSLILDGIRKR